MSAGDLSVIDGQTTAEELAKAIKAADSPRPSSPVNKRLWSSVDSDDAASPAAGSPADRRLRQTLNTSPLRSGPRPLSAQTPATEITQELADAVTAALKPNGLTATAAPSRGVADLTSEQSRLVEQAMFGREITQAEILHREQRPDGPKWHGNLQGTVAYNPDGSSLVDTSKFFEGVRDVASDTARESLRAQMAAKYIDPTTLGTMLRGLDALDPSDPANSYIYDPAGQIPLEFGNSVDTLVGQGESKTVFAGLPGTQSQVVAMLRDFERYSQDWRTYIRVMLARFDRAQSVTLDLVQDLHGNGSIDSADAGALSKHLESGSELGALLGSAFTSMSMFPRRNSAPSVTAPQTAEPFGPEVKMMQAAAKKIQEATKELKSMPKPNSGQRGGYRTQRPGSENGNRGFRKPDLRRQERTAEEKGQRAKSNSSQSQGKGTGQGDGPAAGGGRGRTGGGRGTRGRGRGRGPRGKGRGGR
jgi:hypothetical protein